MGLIRRFLLLLLWIPVFLVTGCSNMPEKPNSNSQKYKQAVSDFYVSLAAMQTDHALFAIKKMQEVTEAYPAEPAAWANLSVYAMRQGSFDAATSRIEKALDRAKNNTQIQFLAGILESRKGNIQASLDHLQKAAKLDSTNLKIRFTLAQELEREDAESHAGQINKLFDQILAQDPNNLAVLAEKVRIAAGQNNLSVLEQNLQKLEKQSRYWPDAIKKQFDEQKSTILQKSGNDVSFELAFLRNNLNQLPAFQHDLRHVQLPPDQIGFLISEFFWLPNPSRTVVPIDSNLTFTASDTTQTLDQPQFFKILALSGGQHGTTISVKGNQAKIGTQTLDFPGDNSGEKFSPHAIAALDYNYDFLNDLAFAGPGGFKLYKQQGDSTFTDVTKTLNLPSSVLRKYYNGIWTYDFDLDGDLDILLSSKTGGSSVLRNNGDSTFDVRSYFDEKSPVRNFLWGDFDRDGDPDAVILTDQNEVHYYIDNRGADFQRDSAFSLSGPVQAINFGDLNNDGIFEIVSLQNDQISSTSYSDSTVSWHTESLIKIDENGKKIGQNPQIFIADLDNNGGLDLLVSGQNSSEYWLTNKDITLSKKTHQISANIYNLFDVNGDARLDLIGLNQENKPAIGFNHGSENYHGQMVRPHASGPMGDQRINSFGIGGEIESRSGLQYVKQPIQKPWTHIGLGTYKQADMVRIIWPNGSVQAQFAELGYDSEIKNEQLLKGSCPWVFTYNGKQMEFVTDFIWRTALGLRINLQSESNVIHSIDWIKIKSNQLQPHDGFYDVRITADLWETHFFDHVSLMAVDHPQNTDVFVDERFKLPAPEQKLYPMQSVYPVQSATDQDGRNLTQKVAEKDGNYVHSFSLTSYQGLAQDHYIEVDVGNKKSTKGAQKLLAYGWVYPTDTSINIAINQNDHKPLYGVRVKVPDGKGDWKTVHKDMGFPSGKNKTMIINLDGIFEPGTPHKVRLYTNMEIYWDQIRVGVQNDDIRLQTHRLEADSVNLHYRGFSKLIKKYRFTPTVPDYQHIAGTTAKWRDLIGFYTRYGDVKELTKKSDDRYVIMNAGDELKFKFPALTPPQKGWTRDFVLIGDGWVKDGDLNTDHSKTVRPLPYHGMENYSQEPGLLEDDPVYQKHKQDWINYHTRFVTPQPFNTALTFENR